ncbi:aldo/keto reductase [Mycobacterium simiae]|uniref:Dehydrogenase n=1 Tax=Mycobacterium simiae TaxID=1784 RepID=A0A1X0Y705_MYCSI|nr:aldo/keto reductase [Mycobacterium simiae]ORJ60935.1 dehydrogenase [Mycobacterium simiae]
METVEKLYQHEFVLNNGRKMPALGFGTSLSDNRKTRETVKTAVEVGFRHLDAAERYRNEAEVGTALKELFAAGVVRRDDLFVTTKLWNNNHRPERVRPALQASLNRLGLDAVDLYLVHTPFAFRPGDDQDPRDVHGAVIYDTGVTLPQTWAAMENLVDEGLTAAIGLSDIDADGTRRILETSRVKPAVVEVESHPYHPQWELHELCNAQDIILLAFASLGHALQPRLLDDPLIVDIARRFGKTPAQVLLAWGIQRGSAVLTGSVNPARIRENFDVTALPQRALDEIDERLVTRIRFNSVADAGVPGFAEVPTGG